MTDYISRADAIEAVRSYFKDRMGKSKCDYDEELQVYVISKEERTMLTYNKGINDKLRSLPSAEAEWISCSERLPSDGDTVIVSVVDDSGDTSWCYTGVAWLCNGTWIADNEILFGDAIAWMPLPKPYREESEVEE